jgi:lipoyl(octanoyl) transferase
LHVYLLGQVGFEAALLLQRRLLYEVRGERRHGALILCEHPPLITVGRQGSFGHILCEPRELQARQWQVRWVNRGGRCVLHVPGQLAVYPIIPLDGLGLGVRDYLERLQQTVRDLVADFGIKAAQPNGASGVWVRDRLLAAVGIAVRDWVSYYGTYVNVNPTLDGFRLVRCAGPLAAPMTSMERERHGPVRMALARERFLEHFARRFGFGRTVLFTQHQQLTPPLPSRPKPAHQPRPEA